MDEKVKKQITEAIKQYAEIHDLSQDDLAKVAGLNVSYINAIMNSEFKIGKTNIKDAYFKRLADIIGINTEITYVSHVNTPQFNQIYSELLDAKVTGRVKVIISSTGIGKTYTVDKFLNDQPAHTYKITLSSLYTLHDVLNDLCKIFNIEMSRAFSHRTRLREVTKKLKAKKDNGHLPVIIFDEAENANVATLRMMKAFYDEARHFCSIVLIGTPQLLSKLDKMREKDIEGMSQFYRRFKSGIREISPINKNKQFVPFLEQIEDKNLHVLLESISDNYGELTDFIGHALKEAARMNLPLTEQFFRQLFGLNRD